MFLTKLLLLKTLKIVHFFGRIVCCRRKERYDIFTDPSNFPPQYVNPFAYLEILRNTREGLLKKKLGWDVIDLILKEMLKEMILKLAHEAKRGNSYTEDSYTEFARAHNRYYTMYALQLLLTVNISEKWTFSFRYLPRPEHWMQFYDNVGSLMSEGYFAYFIKSMHDSNRVHAFHYSEGMEWKGRYGTPVFMERGNVYFTLTDG